ncbi:MAG: hypothetical protein K2O05_00980 [Anaeroplasmataceae bacterium]|nr:hypothetical protein [Anaeroplasmataceae bacterium]
MGRPKGKKSTYRFYTAEEKLNLIKPVMKGIKSSWDVERESQVKHSLIIKWIKQYQDGGIKELENKRKPGNPLQKYQARKELTEIEKLEYEILKLRIENERLKKGYTKKEADQAKEKKSSKKNMR